jgi:hypothetical protein
MKMATPRTPNQLRADAATMETQLRFLCDSLSFNFDEIRRELKQKWTLEDAEAAQLAAAAEDAVSPERICLKRALACQRANDAAGGRQAALDWLKLKHGVQIGDTVELSGFKRPRTVVLRDFELVLERGDIDECYADFIGTCISQIIKGSAPESHMQPIYRAVKKLA